MTSAVPATKKRSKKKLLLFEIESGERKSEREGKSESSERENRLRALHNFRRFSWEKKRILFPFLSSPNKIGRGALLGGTGGDIVPTVTASGGAVMALRGVAEVRD